MLSSAAENADKRRAVLSTRRQRARYSTRCGRKMIIVFLMFIVILQKAQQMFFSVRKLSSNRSRLKTLQRQDGEGSGTGTGTGTLVVDCDKAIWRAG
jgi:hypothetical protein